MGGPVTVTHPDVTRYFMTVEEAVQLVIQAGAIGESGEALVLDMGEPVRIADVARRLADEADRPIEIVYTGLRPGEKLHEVLQGSRRGPAALGPPAHRPGRRRAARPGTRSSTSPPATPSPSAGCWRSTRHRAPTSQRRTDLPEGSV